MKKAFITLLLLSLTFAIFPSCQSTMEGKNEKKMDARVIHSSMSKAISIRSDYNDYYLEYTLRNTGNKNIESISGVILFLRDGKAIQEYGPFPLYKGESLLKPGYEISVKRIISMPIFSWNGKDYKINVQEITLEKPKKESNNQKS